MGRWDAYYDHHAGRAPRPALGRAVDAVRSRTAPPRLAVDLGCGQGTETLALLDLGWRVLAVDAEPEAARRLLDRVPPAQMDRIAVRTATFADVELPPADLVWSALALPFCGRDELHAVWAATRASLVPGGVVAVDLWGERHAWADRATTLTRAELGDLLAGLDVLELDEQEEERATVAEGVQHWHAFAVIARQP